MSTYHIFGNFNKMCVDWVVADCAGFSIERKKALKNLFLMVRYCVIFVYEIMKILIGSLWKHGLVWPLFVARG